MWYVICFMAGGWIGALTMGLLARGKMQDYEDRLGWSETQRLRLQSRIDHEEGNSEYWEKMRRKYLGDLAYSDDIKEKP